MVVMGGDRRRGSRPARLSGRDRAVCGNVAELEVAKICRLLTLTRILNHFKVVEVNRFYSNLPVRFRPSDCPFAWPDLTN